MTFKIKDRVLRVLNIKTKDGYLQETVGRRSMSCCSFRGMLFYGPPNTMIYQRALITQNNKEYIVLWYMSGLQTHVYINLTSAFSNSPFVEITDNQEFADINNFVCWKKLDRIEIGDEVPYVSEENPMGF